MSDSFEDFTLPGLKRDDWKTFPYRLTGVKSIPGHDGDVVHATLRKGTKKVGEFGNDSWGGPDWFRFDNPQDKAAFEEAVLATFDEENAHHAMDSHVGAFLLALYEATRLSKKGTVMVPARVRRGWYWEGAMNVLNTADWGEVVNWYAANGDSAAPEVAIDVDGMTTREIVEEQA